jgi:uncharacterized membrane protein
MATMGKARVEAFSDGVLAVAITLLVLDLKVQTDGGPLGSQLRHELPQFAAYVVSFFIIGVIWVNHHALFSLAARLDRQVVFYNLLLLMWVATIPFTTEVLADYLLDHGSDARYAVVLYGLSSEGMAISFTLILRRLIRHGLLYRPVTQDEGRRAVRRFGLGTVVYPIIVLVGLVSPIAMLALYTLQTGFYVVEQTPILPAAPVTPSES